MILLGNESRDGFIMTDVSRTLFNRKFEKQSPAANAPWGNKTAGISCFFISGAALIRAIHDGIVYGVASLSSKYQLNMFDIAKCMFSRK